MSTPTIRRLVFVVDDEPLITLTLCEILKREGYEVVGFTDPVKALQAAQESSPNLVIADVLMPELSGIDLAIAIEKMLPGCKVILFSGQSSTVDMLKAACELGHQFEVLAKPVPPVEMLGRVRNVFGLDARADAAEGGLQQFDA